MSGLPNATITYANGSGRRAPGQDHISGLIFGGVAVSGTFALGTMYELRQLSDAEALGINAAYDTTNGILVYNHIKDFFNEAPGATLLIMGVAQGTTLANMCDKTLTYAQKLINDAGGRLRRIGVVLNPDMDSYSPTLTIGLDADVIAAIPKAKALRAQAIVDHRPVVVFIEGREFNGSVGSAVDLRTKAAAGVGVVIAQDPAHKALDNSGVFDDVAAVGKVLGMSARAKVHQSVGNPRNFPLTNADTGSFVTANLSSGSSVESYGVTSLGALYDKGYILPRWVVGLPGYYLAGDPACDDATSDFAFMADALTIDKGHRAIYAQLAPNINGEMLINDNGTPAAAEIGDFEAQGKTALTKALVETGEASNADCYIDPTQDIQSTGELQVQYSITQKATLRNLSGTIGFGPITQ